MVQKTKKRTLFLIGLLVTGITGVVGPHVRSNYSKDGSLLPTLFVPEAHADVSAYIDNSGCGCGGCSGGDSGY